MSRIERDEPDGAEGEQAVELPITGELDLHTFAPRDVVDVVGDYLDACRERGITRARLIHGRGRGVQRAAVHRLLERRPDVAAFDDASPDLGGWGATLVTLHGGR